MIRRQEVPHNTPEQVVSYLRAALELTEALDPPDDLRPTVFAKACDLFSAKQLLLEQPAPMGLPTMQIPRG